MEDIPLLADQFIARFNRLQGKAVQGISAEALSLLMAHRWPGNIRELENVVERAFILCSEGHIDIQHLPGDLIGQSTPAGTGSSVRSIHDILDVQAIRAALEKTGSNRLLAARELGIHKTTLFRKIKKLGIPLPERDGRNHPRCSGIDESEKNNRKPVSSRPTK